MGDVKRGLSSVQVPVSEVKRSLSSVQVPVGEVKRSLASVGILHPCQVPVGDVGAEVIPSRAGDEVTGRPDLPRHPPPLPCLPLLHLGLLGYFPI